MAADTHREAQFLEFLSTERTSSLIAQTVLALRLKCCLPQAVKDVSLVLVSQGKEIKKKKKNLTVQQFPQGDQ